LTPRARKPGFKCYTRGVHANTRQGYPQLQESESLKDLWREQLWGAEAVIPREIWPREGRLEAEQGNSEETLRAERHRSELHANRSKCGGRQLKSGGASRGAVLPRDFRFFSESLIWARGHLQRQFETGRHTYLSENRQQIVFYGVLA